MILVVWRFRGPVYGLGLAVNLDVESNINISNNSRVAGISLTQGNTVNNTYTTESHTWDNNISVIDSVMLPTY